MKTHEYEWKELGIDGRGQYTKGADGIKRYPTGIFDRPSRNIAEAVLVRLGESYLELCRKANKTPAEKRQQMRIRTSAITLGDKSLSRK